MLKVMMDVVQIMYSGHVPGEEHLKRVSELLAEHRVVVPESAQEALDAAADSTIVLGHRYLHQLLPVAPRLEWVQASSSGTDHLPTNVLRERGIILTRTDIAGPVIAQHAIMLSFALNRRLADCLRFQDQGHWGGELHDTMPPRLRRAFVLGLGSIGRTAAGILAAAGVEVWGVSRSGEAVPDVTRVYSESQDWLSVWPKMDLVVVCLPLDSKTRGIVSRAALEQLRPTATVVNVSRAECVDLEALTEMLNSGMLAGAASDVFGGRTPIPDDSPLWRVPNFLITPYVAARYLDRGRDLEHFVESQLMRRASGESLSLVV